jgi:hypothetical protein
MQPYILIEINYITLLDMGALSYASPMEGSISGESTILLQ